MKFYSEELNKFFDSVESCMAAEEEYAKKIEEEEKQKIAFEKEKLEALKKIQKLKEEAKIAQDKYIKEVIDYRKKLYGSEYIEDNIVDMFKKLFE